MAALQTNSAPVQKITIVPRTSGALGFTMQVEDGDHTLMTKEEILNKIATLTGGRAAEELISTPSPPVHPMISSRPPSWPAPSSPATA